MWQEFSSHGMQSFNDRVLLIKRKAEIEDALSGLMKDIARVANQVDKSGLALALEIREKPSVWQKSLYECLNQLIHYWHCCCAGLHLFDGGATMLEMRPTGHANSSKHGNVYDLAVKKDNKLLVCAEVFCVSNALWGQKMSRTAEKLVREGEAPATAYRLIYCNSRENAKTSTEVPGVVVYGISREGEVTIVKSNDQRIYEGRHLKLR